MTILVVDDEKVYRLLIRDILSQHRYDVVQAEDGQEALSKMAMMKIDFIISDVYMPVMDGFKFHQAVRARPEWENIPFLFVSAYDDHHTLDIIKEPKREAFLKKGRPTNELLDWIKYLATPEEERPRVKPGSSLRPL